MVSCSAARHSEPRDLSNHVFKYKKGDDFDQGAMNRGEEYNSKPKFYSDNSQTSVF